MLGIIGGTGLYQLEALRVLETHEVETPFGPPSAPIIVGDLGRTRVAFLPRHGLRHELLPSEINFRANIYALKRLGARALTGVSAVGSLVMEIAPGDLALPSQYFDWTRGRRAGTFFGNGLAGHVSTADPVCPMLSEQIAAAAHALGLKLHTKLTYGCVEGPRLGTRAESVFLKNNGCHLVGMTNMPEAALAREAQLPYATITIATDYDCWLDDPTLHARADQIMDLYRANIGRVKALLVALCDRDLTGMNQWPARSALRHALLTPRTALSPEHVEILRVLEG